MLGITEQAIISIETRLSHMEKYLPRSQDILHMPQCVHLPLRMRTYQIGSVLYFVAPIVILTIHHMKIPKIILI